MALLLEEPLSNINPQACSELTSASTAYIFYVYAAVDAA